jgi:hypothetical protein
MKPGLLGRSGKIPLILPLFRQSYLQRVKRLFGGALIAYWALNESSGTSANDLSENGYHGVYSGVSLANLAAPGGSSAPLFDGVNDYVNIGDSGIGAEYDGDEGSLFIWYRPFNAGVLSDGSTDLVIQIVTSTLSWIAIQKATTAGRLTIQRRADDSSLKSVNLDGVTAANWLHLGCTWSRNADEFRVYRDGSQTGATLTGLTAITGSINTQYTNVGVSYRPTLANPLNGWAAHALLLNRAASPTEIARLAAWA